jgi:ABC-2 type transport system permease protein
VIAFLARHEWRVLSASAIVRLVLTAFVAALAFAAGQGASRLVRERDTVEAFSDRLDVQRVRPASLRADALGNDRGWLALLPPAPLGALAVGQSDVFPSYVKVTARTLDALVTGDQIEHPLAVASGQFDVAFVVLFLYPLLIFAVSFDLTASERDRGTLRLVLAQPVHLRDVVAGKMIARALLVGLPVLIIPVIAAIASGASVLVLSLWTIGVAAYGAIWHGVALLVNARGRPAAANALTLAGLWLLFTIVGPSTINLLVALRYPMPSRVEAAVQARAATQEATVQGSRDLGQFLQDHPTSANVGREGMRQFARLQAARDAQVAEKLQQVDAAFDAQLRRQRQLASWLSVLSPTMIAQDVLLEVAGTSASRYERFDAEASAFQARWRDYFEPRILDAATLTASEYAAAPRFQFVGEDPMAAMHRTLPWMAAMTAAAVMLIWLGFRRYREYLL